MRLTRESFTAVANLAPDQVLTCKNVGDDVALVQVEKKSVSWRDRILAFFGCGPCTLRHITGLFNQAVKDNNSDVTSEAIQKLNARISTFNNKGLRKYISFLQIDEIKAPPPPAPPPPPQPAPVRQEEPQERRWEHAAAGTWEQGGRLGICGKEGLKVIGKTECPHIIISTYLKEVPQELFRQQHIEVLSFTKTTEIYGLPKEIGQLENLKSLSVKSKYLQEPIPAEIGNCRKLQTLTLKGCGVSLPPEIGKLSELKELTIDAWDFTHLPEEISDLGSLESLSIRGYSTESIPQNIGNCKKLKQLTLQCRNIEHFPASLWELSNLESLVICSDTLKEIPADIQKLTSLRHLTVISKDLQLKDIPQSLLPSLETLEVKKWG